MIWDHYDEGTARAVLALYRSADRILEAGGERLAAWMPGPGRLGRQDPYISIDEGRFYESRLPSGRCVALDRAGHWPWIDDPSDRPVTGFLAAPVR